MIDLVKFTQMLDSQKIVYKRYKHKDTIEIAIQINGKTKGTVAIGAEEDKDSVLAKAKEVIADKLTGNIVKEIYVPGRIVNIVMK